MEDVRFLETHGEIFLGGKNMGKKHSPKRLTGLSLQWDEVKRRCEMKWNGELGYILEGNVAYWVPEIGPKVGIPTNEHRTESVEGRKRAQVSTPMGHVFEGPGKGKVRQ